MLKKSFMLCAVLFLSVFVFADSTVVNDFDVFRVEDGGWYKYRNFDDPEKLTLCFTYLNLIGVPSDSIHCKWTQYVFWSGDSCVIYNYNYSNMLMIQDTVSGDFMDDDFWRLIYEDKEIDVIPME